MPADPAIAKALETLDPFELRARGLDHPLPLTHLGRALFHLDQRRGFKSNRKAEGNIEGGKIASGSERLDHTMLASGSRTYGEFLHKRRAVASDPRAMPPVRTRLTLRQDQEGKSEAGYDFYPDRRHLEEECRKLWLAQQRHHPELSDELYGVVFKTIFFQRPLAPPKVGRCLFVAEPRYCNLTSGNSACARAS